MNKKTIEISEKARNEIGLRVMAKAEEIRAKEAAQDLTLDSIEEMWGCLKKESHDIIEEFFNEMLNSTNEKAIVKKNLRNSKRVL